MHRSSTLLFLLLAGATNYQFLCMAGSGFDSLVAEYIQDRGVAVASLEVSKQQYLDDVDGILAVTGDVLKLTEESMFKCLATAQAEFGMGSNQYRKQALKCLLSFDKTTNNEWEANFAKVDKAREGLKNNVQQFEDFVDKQLLGLRGRLGGDSMLNDAQRIELQQLEEEQENSKLENARMLRSFDAEFSDDAICIDIDNSKKELDSAQSLELAKRIIPYLSQDLTNLGTDYYISELSLVNQTLDYLNTTAGNATAQEEGNGRQLRQNNGSRRMSTTKILRLSTQWKGKIRFHRAIISDKTNINCTSSGDCYGRNLAAEAAKEHDSFKRLLQDDDKEIEEFRLAEIVVRYMFESLLTDMKDIATAGTTVLARSCGAWPLKDPTIVTINPVQLRDFVDFQKAHERIAAKQTELTQRYEETVEAEYAEFHHELSKQELEYMSCLNDGDQRFKDGEIDLEQRKISHDKCFVLHDTQDNSLLQVYIETINQHKEPFMKKMDNLEEKLSAVISKLDEEEANFALKYLEELTREREEQENTMNQILEEQRKLQLRLQMGIVCNIVGLERIFLASEITTLEDLIERGVDYAFTMCGIDLHVYETTFLSQMFVDRRLQRDDSGVSRRLGSSLITRFDSKWGCTKCTECSAYSDSSGSTSCGSCCLRRRLLTDDIFKHDQNPDCFDTYLTPRVKRLIEVRLHSAIDDGRDEVYVNCQHLKN